MFIIPYFGKFNNYFQLFLNSCEKNPKFDWLIFTNDERTFNYPANVHVHYTTFELLQKRIQNLFDFDIILHQPYKLCDYKIAYGYIFHEYIRDYEFWGYCDIDMLFGRISKFITDEILDQNDRILERGHLTLFRNCEQINKLFMSKHKALFIDYRYAFATKYCCHFDEFEPWNQVMQDMKLRQWVPHVFADISCDTYRFVLEYGNHKKNKQIYLWRDGILSRYYLENGKIYQDEWCYIHLQKRKMILEDSIDNMEYWIVPNKFIAYGEAGHMEKFIDTYGIDEFYLNRKIGRIKEILENILNGALLFRIKRIRIRDK